MVLKPVEIEVKSAIDDETFSDLILQYVWTW